MLVTCLENFFDYMVSLFTDLEMAVEDVAASKEILMAFKPHPLLKLYCLRI